MTDQMTMSDMTTMTIDQMSRQSVTMYSTRWCPDCHRAKFFLKEWGVEYTEVDIETTLGAAEQVMEWANGKRVVPTILVDESVMVNPKIRDLASKLGVAY